MPTQKWHDKKIVNFRNSANRRIYRRSEGPVGCVFQWIASVMVERPLCPGVWVWLVGLCCVAVVVGSPFAVQIVSSPSRMSIDRDSNQGLIWAPVTVQITLNNVTGSATTDLATLLACLDLSLSRVALVGGTTLALSGVTQLPLSTASAILSAAGTLTAIQMSFYNVTVRAVPGGWARLRAELLVILSGSTVTGSPTAVMPNIMAVLASRSSVTSWCSNWALSGAVNWPVVGKLGAFVLGGGSWSSGNWSSCSDIMSSEESIGISGLYLPVPSPALAYVGASWSAIAAAVASISNSSLLVTATPTGHLLCSASVSVAVSLCRSGTQPIGFMCQTCGSSAINLLVNISRWSTWVGSVLGPAVVALSSAGVTTVRVAPSVDRWIGSVSRAFFFARATCQSIYSM
jgi:hypothetical protein